MLYCNSETGLIFNPDIPKFWLLACAIHQKMANLVVVIEEQNYAHLSLSVYKLIQISV